ncbi:MAG: hypothetical protein A2114_00795 [Candidatus Vogelbacteria bacterium GWA1_51_14]|uniref:Uncharacterized protein n=1 Tax=Candidatus Vogelbacteria bacterium GWA1_51_14 TaxID=1802435 RepID=A0A1G2Q9C4_9BACT|nr:MAG: hypothetical protein A2114_00795 [Candidatus Vogelbacteria bacterium GWA1_51_14]
MSRFIKIKVTAGARRESVEEVSENSYAVNVKVKAEKNQANIRALELLNNYLNLPPRSIRLISGHHHPHKLAEVME